MILEMMTGLILWYRHYHLRILPDLVKLYGLRGELDSDGGPPACTIRA